jgi:starvation-inducible DNA-binding protein
MNEVCIATRSVTGGLTTMETEGSSMTRTHYTVPTMAPEQAGKVIDLLQGRLVSLIDLQLTLKYVHWNVVGPNFVAVHEMLDPHVDAVREMTDTIAERIATIGGEPQGTPGYVAHHRSWDDYDLGRADTQEHLAKLDTVYQGIIGDHRACLREVEELDQVSHNVLVDQLEQLEMFHWFVRAHLGSRA